ncbi:hypothetical protein TraAM80_07438 [Trypanosoma rangeli]|uniref:Uncharacterized protein n=1 Tax=Trypanosoma rangeli TaxID=5698 RepID=A0A3R7KSX3_TRYRA|nr:uncharacterized protein TraAM80_07438 [Trypanosoma rangeli]RNF00705.1 hypothetical protein TraAM80_07438 [Trypanosoma rangeli]|eukprot:RNF00705.1 hypothetical protein TraAM80_07438 [Trypanosoma rangeli]
MDDWERAYEEDRRRLAEGKDIVLDIRRGDAGTTMFEEKGPAPMDTLSPGASGKATVPEIVSVPLGPMTTTTFRRTGDAASDFPVFHEGEAEALEIHTTYSDEPVQRVRQVGIDDYYSDNNERRQQAQLHDARFNITCLPLGRNLCDLFGAKMGRRVFFAGVVTSLFKGFFGSKKTLVACFVTPNCLYIGNVQTGAVIVCIDIQRLHEIHVFGDLALGLRTLDAFDLFLQVPQQTERLVDILKRIAAFWKVCVKVLRSTFDQAKVFKKEMHLIDKNSHSWRLVEDPRTGLRIVNITGQFVGIFAPIAHKILHWFGFVTELAKSWKGSTKKRRCAWVTATCFFVAKENGPGPCGRNIIRCAAMEYMTELYVGPGVELGVVVAAGPPQPPISLMFDSEEDKNAVVFVLQECYTYRSHGGSIKVTHVNSVEERIRVTKAAEQFQLQLFRMRSTKELYEFMRSPSQRS